jgi:hypothetical protein
MTASAAVGRYDGALQMFVEGPRDVDPAYLNFVRWLVEHRAAGPATGELAELMRFDGQGPSKWV